MSLIIQATTCHSSNKWLNANFLIMKDIERMTLKHIWKGKDKSVSC